MSKIHLGLKTSLIKEKKILLLGASGTLGQEIKKLIKNNTNFFVLTPSSSSLNFNEPNSKKILFNLLNKYNFDIIVNCIGVFGNNSKDFNNIINPNLKSNWEIINFFLNKNPKKTVKIFLIGSSAYSGPRKNYMLYAASKSALNSLYKSANEYFIHKKIFFFIKHPRPFKSRMTRNVSKNKLKNDPKIIANQIYKMIKKKN